MCGIVGYIGEKNCIPILIGGLKRLEYRGYDSAGVGLIYDHSVNVIKSVGKVSLLEEKLEKMNLTSHLGIGHTRWATHGEPNEINAHPHMSEDNSLMLIHNGIIENYAVLKRKLIDEGFKFRSETDTEVLVQLIFSYLKKGFKLLRAVQAALNEVEGTYGIAVLYKNEPDKIVAARKGSQIGRAHV